MNETKTNTNETKELTLEQKQTLKSFRDAYYKVEDLRDEFRRAYLSATEGQDTWRSDEVNAIYARYFANIAGDIGVLLMSACFKFTRIARDPEVFEALRVDLGVDEQELKEMLNEDCEKTINLHRETFEKTLELNERC